ncbi:MAG: alpha-amylase family glycosyl hydrolase [Saprospiraceae bacterium]
MKKNLLIFLSLVLAACTTQPAEKTSDAVTEDFPAHHFPEKLAGSTIYEVNIRQYTPEGTFAAFTDQLPRLKELGVDVLWLMPIHPISETNRKGTLGSYYAPSSYTDVNPEFGTLDEFKAMLAKAHEMGFYLILDWVPNHTGRDHHWIAEHPDYYVRDAEGNVTYESMSPTDVWWDTALLDHSNPETRKAMIAAMRFWVDLGVDGFRLDHGCGDKIPLYLWEEARAELDPLRDLFWLAECEHETFILDGSYAVAFEVLMRDVASGKATADDLTAWIDADMFEFGRTAYRMTYTTNHDLNSWNGTVFERLGAGHQTFAAMVFTAYGFPLIYSGQEMGISKRLQFFERDPIEWTDSLKLQPFYKSLVALHKENPALWAGDAGGFPVSIENNPQVMAFVRTAGDNQVIGIFNLSDAPQSLELTNNAVFGTYTDYFSGKEYTLSASGMDLTPWQYLVFVK